MLPIYNTLTQKVFEPVYSSLFEVDIKSKSVSEKDLTYLTDNIFSIKNNIINVNVLDDFKTTQILINLNNSAFDMILKTHNKDGLITSILKYTECSFKDLGYSFLDFEWSNSKILSYKIEFIYKDFKLYNKSQYERMEKIKNLI